MARKKKYNTRTLRSAINRYFNSISYMETATRLVPSGEFNKAGNPIMIPEAITNSYGDKIQYKEYAVPPTIEGMCNYLGLTRQALNKYKSDVNDGDTYTEIIEKARMEIEQYLHQKLNTRDKGQAGIQFDLQCNFGWGVEKNDITTEIVLDKELEEWAN